jgi:hypothetical protein
MAGAAGGRRQTAGLLLGGEGMGPGDGWDVNGWFGHGKERDGDRSVAHEWAEGPVPAAAGLATQWVLIYSRRIRRSGQLLDS